MQHRRLGQSDIHVSPVALGCWALIGGFNWGPQDEADSIAAIEAALDSGVNFFDTAPGYGDGASERLLGRVLAPRRDEVVIATKVGAGDLAPDRLAASCHASLERLGTDRIDVYQIHWPNWEVPLGDSLDAMARLRDQGKVRAIGVSNFGRRDLTDALAWGEITSNQLAYNLLARMIEHEIQPLCAEHHVSILAYSPLMQGLLTGKFRQAADVPADRARTRHFASTWPQARHGEAGCEAETFEAIDRVRAIADELGQPMSAVALAWCLHQPAVASVLAGARSASQVRDNLAGASLALDDATLAALDEATAPVKQRLGPVADLWAGQPRMR